MGILDLKKRRKNESLMPLIAIEGRSKRTIYIR